jgi:uncharacterized RDD family membrane protein YckC
MVTTHWRLTPLDVRRQWCSVPISSPAGHMQETQDMGDSSGPASGWNAAVQLRRGPAVGLAYGGFWIRVVAFLIDGLVLGLITSPLAPGAYTFDQTGPNYFELNYGATALSGIFSTLLGIVYFVGFWAWRGQTPGMMLFKLRVVRADDGGDVDIGRSLVRYLGLIVAFAAILIGVIWAAFDSRKQGWHDKIGGTVVVRPA